jgi:hypothetical protein
MSNSETVTNRLNKSQFQCQCQFHEEHTCALAVRFMMIEIRLQVYGHLAVFIIRKNVLCCCFTLLMCLGAFARLEPWPSWRIFCQTSKIFRHLVGLHGRRVSPSQGLYLHRTTEHRKTRTHALYLHRTTQHRKTRTHIHASSGITVFERLKPTSQIARPLLPARDRSRKLIYHMTRSAVTGDHTSSRDITWFSVS